MIKIENTKVEGWEAAIRGMRNPMNSWEKSDTVFDIFCDDNGPYRGDWFGHTLTQPIAKCDRKYLDGETYHAVEIGPNDMKLMKSLVAGGPVHAKFRRFISVTMDLTAPFYWWNDFDTYRIGRCDANGATSFWGHDIEYDSCSTMHKIQDKEFTLDDFSHEHLISFNDIPEWRDTICTEIDEEYEVEVMINNPLITVGDNSFISPVGDLKIVIQMLNKCRELYLETKDKKYWWQMIQLLPNSYHQKRTVKLNYEVLAGLYSMRKDHKQDEFRQFCEWIETLPYAKELIVGEETVKDTEEQLRARFRSYEDRILYLEKMMCKELHIAGMSIHDISKRMSMAESTVKHFVDEGE